jgi:hypothetical protein
MGSKKRNLDKDSDKVSPPGKMGRSQNIGESGTQEILAKLDLIEARFANIEKEVVEIRKVLKEMENVKAEMETIKTAVTGLQRLELDSKRRCVLIRGLKFQTEEKFETRPQTKEALAEFFRLIDMTPHLVDYHRLGGRKSDEDGSKVSVRVEFADVDQKFRLFELLRSKGRELAKYSVLTDYPSFQIPTFKNLSEKAYNLRVANPGTKTRIVARGLDLVLQRRANLSDKWMAVSA